MKPTEAAIMKAMDSLVATNKYLMDTVQGLLQKMQQEELLRAQQQREKNEKIQNLVKVKIQEMLGIDFGMAALFGELLGRREGLLGFDGQTIETHLAILLHISKRAGGTRDRRPAGGGGRMHKTFQGPAGRG